MSLSWDQGPVFEDFMVQKVIEEFASRCAPIIHLSKIISHSLVTVH